MRKFMEYNPVTQTVLYPSGKRLSYFCGEKLHEVDTIILRLYEGTLTPMQAQILIKNFLLTQGGML